jgi:hypothetical protein
MRRLANGAAVLAAISALGAGAAFAQPPDLVLLDGKIVAVDAQASVREALAIRDGKILRVGGTREIRALAGPTTRVVELGGRTLIPGLIDSHLHAVRAALSFSTEVNWIGTRSLREALARISDAAKRRPPGSWLVVAGGWNELQFAERRRPTQAELEAAAPNNPVYVQLGYDAAGKIHTDLAKGFIRAEVTAFQDLESAGSMKEVKARNLQRLEGKEYVIKDGDVVFFRSGL